MRRTNTVRTVLVGAAAGLFAAYVMERAQAALSELPLDTGGDTGAQDEPSTVKAADRAALAATGRPVPHDQRERAGRLVHYAMGAALGVAYTLLADGRRTVSAGFGGLYGLAVSLFLDEGAVPALRLSPPPSRTPLAGHLYGVAAHLAYGWALEFGRRTLAGPDRR